MRWILLGLVLLWPCQALAQTDGTGGTVFQGSASDGDQRPDAPRGAPYHTGVSQPVATSNDVPLRDYLSSRIDQLRTEVVDRIGQLREEQRIIINERDERYSQRFEAQQKALNDAFLAAKEAVAQALSAAKEAVVKAELSTEKRFESVNEFRQTLSDQTAGFVTKDSADIRFAALGTAIENNARLVAAIDVRLTQIASRGAGVNDAWVYLVGAVGLLGAVGGIIMLVINLTKRPQPAGKA